MFPNEAVEVEPTNDLENELNWREVITTEARTLVTNGTLEKPNLSQ